MMTVARSLTLAAVITASFVRADDGWRSLFDGKTTAGWEEITGKPFPTNCWAVEDGALKAVVRTDGFQDIRTKETFGSFELDLARFELRREGRKLETTPTELKLLTVFVRNRGKVLTRERLLEEVWGSGVYVSDRVVDNHVVALRKKLGDDPAAPRYLVSVRSVGYRFDG